MRLRVVRFDSGSSFLAELEPFLSEDEVGNSLILGIAQTARSRSRSHRRHRPVLAAVEDSGGFILAAVMNSPHKLLLASHRETPDEAVEALVRDIQLTNPQLPAVFGPVTISSRFAALWAEYAAAVPQMGLRQQLYRLERLVPPDFWPSGGFRPADEDESDELGQWLQAFQAEALPEETADLDSARLIMSRIIAEGNLFVWEADTHHAMSMAARARPTANSIAINLVYTPYLFRGQGYATACVARLSEHLVSEGWQNITLFTDLTNETANHIYQRLGYMPVGEFEEYRFMYPDDVETKASLLAGGSA